MELLNWTSGSVLLVVISFCNASLIIEEAVNGGTKEHRIATLVEKESERLVNLLRSYLHENPNKPSKGFFDNLEDCLLIDKDKEVIKEVQYIFIENQCVTVGETCTRSGNFRESIKDLEITIGGAEENPSQSRPPPRPPVSTRCCNFTLCRSNKCCIPTASSAESPACSMNDDCCDDGVCDTDFSRLCKVRSQGQCTKNEQCLKGSCQLGLCCINPLDTCHKCTDSNDCCGKGPCSGGLCLANNGNYCNDNTQCASGTCCSSKKCGLPTPTPPNLAPGTLQKCTSNGDCCDSGLCETKSGTCRYPDASACTADHQCIHNECHNNEKCCFDTTQGDQCVNARTYCCWSSAVCKPITMPDGSQISICGYP